LGVFQIFVLIWGAAHHSFFSVFLHSSSIFNASTDIQISSGIYAAAVGLFFGSLLVIGASEELDSLTTLSQESKIYFGYRLSSKFLMSITVTVTAFLIGGVGVTSQLFSAGLTVTQMLPRIAIVAVPFILLTLIIVYFLIRATTHNLTRSLPKIERLSENDLAQEFDVGSHDEIGRLFGMLNLFLLNLRRMIGFIQLATDQTKTRSTELLKTITGSQDSSADVSRIAQGLRDVVISQASTVTEVAAAVEEIVKTIENQDQKISHQSASVTQSSAAIEEMIASVRSITDNLNQNSTEFDTLKHSVNQGAENLGKLENLVKEITEKSVSVNQANSVIMTIAAQTNLLAMNAAIEAAHAGDAGRGFSVVAEEIRKLAENANQQSGQISANIKALNVSMGEASSISKSTGESFMAIQESVGSVTTIEEQIKLSLQELSSGSTQILQALSNISEITQEVHGGSTEMVNGGKEALKEIAGLVDQTTHMKDSTLEIIEKIETVNSAVKESASEVQATVRSVEDIDTELAKFTIDHGRET
jgi:methyl-accepting chemotaxis protein